MKKPYRQADGFYHVDGKKYKTLFGSREQVMNGTVHKTTGGLTKADLVMNKWGRIVSAKKFKTAKKEMRLQKHGFFAKKGKFGAITRKFRGGDPTGTVNTAAASTAVPKTDAAASTDAASTGAASTGANTAAGGANSGANSGANKTKVSKGPQKYDTDGYPINIRKSNKKKISLTREENKEGKK